MSDITIDIKAVDAETEKKLLGIKGWFLKGEKRQAALTSKLVELAIKEKQQSGITLTKEDIDKIKFAYDPAFRQKVIDKVHHDSDKEYYSAIRSCEKSVESLERARDKEIRKIEESRWEKIVVKELKFNLTEGKLMINGSVALFSDIKGAAANITESHRIMTTNESKSKKHASVGGALVGGLMFGAVGAVVGGAALGKTTQKGNTSKDTIPTASHIGVVVDINGFKNEIILMNKLVDQDSDEFLDAIKKAQVIIAKLQQLSVTPVPESYLKPEEEQSVKDYDVKIEEAYKALELAKANVPTYEIPERYL